MSKTMQKKELIQETALHKGDTGSPEVQITILTNKIEELSKHLKKNRKDIPTRRALLKMVSSRRRHLKYLQTKDIKRYNTLIKKLEI